MLKFNKRIASASLAATLVLSSVGVAAIPATAYASTTGTTSTIDSTLTKLVNELTAIHNALSPSQLTAVHNALTLARNASTDDWNTIVYGNADLTTVPNSNQAVVTAFKDLFTLMYADNTDSLKSELEQVKTDVQVIDPTITSTDLYNFFEQFKSAVQQNVLLSVFGTTPTLNLTDIMSQSLEDALNNTQNANGDLVFKNAMTNNGLSVTDIVAIKQRASDMFDSGNDARDALITAVASTKLKAQTVKSIVAGGHSNYNLTISDPGSTFDALDLPNNLITWTSSNPTVAAFGTGEFINKLSAIKQGTTTISAVVKGITLQSFDVSVTPMLGGGGTGGGGGSTPPSPTTIVPVPQGTTVVSAATTTTTETDANGNKITDVIVDESALLAQIGQSTSPEEIVISADTAGGTDKVELPLDLLSKVAALNSNSTFVLQVNGAAYELPTSLLNDDSVANALGVSDASGATVNVLVSEEPQSVADGVESQTGTKVVSKVYDFSIQASEDGKTAELNNFGNTYTDRVFTVNGTEDSNHLAGVLVNSDGTVAPVPTLFENNDGNNIAILKRNGNSTYTVISNDITFTDINGSWAKSDIQLLADKMIVSGFADGTFHPSDQVTRGQFATLLARGLGLSKSTDTVKFSDISNSSYYAGYVQALANAGIVTGYNDGTFHADQNISRQDAMILLSKAIGFLNLRGNLTDADAVASLQKYKDADKVSGYAKEAVGLATSLNIISGDTQGNVNPTGDTTRAEIVIMLEKLLKTAKFM